MADAAHPKRYRRSHVFCPRHTIVDRVTSKGPAFERVSVPRWALEYVLKWATLDDRASFMGDTWQSPEMRVAVKAIREALRTKY